VGEVVELDKTSPSDFARMVSTKVRMAADCKLDIEREFGVRLQC